MTITPILWTYDVCEDGTSSLKIRHSYIEGNKKIRKYYALNIYLKESQWNGKRVKAGLHPNSTEINLKLVDIENTIEREYLNNKNINVETLIKMIINPQHQKEHTVLSYVDFYIQQCRDSQILHYKTKQKLTEGYIKSFDTFKKRLQWYCDLKKINPTFEDITEDFHDQWMHALRYDYQMDEKGELFGLAENSIAKTTKSFKVLMGHAMRKKLHTNIAYLTFSATWHDVENIALSEKEITEIMNVDLSKKEHQYLIPEQERFSIAYNFLLRFNDSISISKKNIFIDDGQPYFKMITGKTKQQVVIPVMPRNYEILKKNNFIIKETNNQNTNERIKALAKLAGLTGDHTITEIRKGKIVQTVYKRFELITTHTTRRSAATNLYHSGLDLKSIQLMGGWKTLTQLETYLKIDKMENAKKLAGHAFFNR